LIHKLATKLGIRDKSFGEREKLLSGTISNTHHLFYQLTFQLFGSNLTIEAFAFG